MATEIIIPSSKEHWLQLRAQDVTSTEVSALFGACPYMTRLRLWVNKRRGLIDGFESDERMRWGTRLEATIASGVAEENNLKICKINAYMRNHDYRIGSSFDYEIYDSHYGRGILEIKNVDEEEYRRKWADPKSGEPNSGYAPPHIELQLQHQMLVSGMEWGVIGVLIGGNKSKLFYRFGDKVRHQEIIEKVGEFWRSIEDDVMPEPDFEKDVETIKDMYRDATPGEVLDATDNIELAELIQEYEYARVTTKNHGKKVEELKARIFAEAKTAELIKGDGFEVHLNTTNGSAPTVITNEMVGKSYGGKSGYRQCRVRIVG